MYWTGNTYQWNEADNYHLNRCRMYLSKGWKRYDEWKHTFYEFKLFWLVHQNNREGYEQFLNWFQKEDAQKRKEKADRIRTEFEQLLLDKMRTNNLFPDYTDERIIKYIKTLSNSKIKKRLKPKKKKKLNPLVLKKTKDKKSDGQDKADGLEA